MTYKLWYSKNAKLPWCLMDEQRNVTFAKHVVVQTPCRTEESEREGSCPPPFTVVVEGTLKMAGETAIVEWERRDSCI